MISISINLIARLHSYMPVTHCMLVLFLVIRHHPQGKFYKSWWHFMAFANLLTKNLHVVQILLGQLRLLLSQDLAGDPKHI